MIAFPNCKINIGLNITGKRADGFHDLQTIFYPVSLTDALEIIHQGSGIPGAEDIFTSSGLSIDSSPENNLCIRALKLMREHHPEIGPVRMHLHKKIPMGAGLGGGSSDACYVLKLLNAGFSLGLDESILMEYAAVLGSDCPFFVINKPCYATGRGDLLEEIKLDLSNYSIVIVDPGIHISTALAFSTIKPGNPGHSIKEIIQSDILYWKKELVNQFEIPVFQSFPELKELKQQLYDAGALYSSMSGSGSCFYGIFPKSALPSIGFKNHYQLYVLN